MNLDELEALEAAATAGPESIRLGADAAFIAALRNAAPELIRLARLGERHDAAYREGRRAVWGEVIEMANDGIRASREPRAALQEGAKP
jgi:hypothetical protein